MRVAVLVMHIPSGVQVLMLRECVGAVRTYLHGCVQCSEWKGLLPCRAFPAITVMPKYETSTTQGSKAGTAKGRYDAVVLPVCRGAIPGEGANDGCPCSPRTHYERVLLPVRTCAPACLLHIKWHLRPKGSFFSSDGQSSCINGCFILGSLSPTRSV